MDERINQLNTQIATLEKEGRSHQDKMAALANQLADVQKANETAQSEIKRVTDEKSVLNKQLSGLLQDKDNLARELKSLQESQPKDILQAQQPLQSLVLVTGLSPKKYSDESSSSALTLYIS